MVVSKSDKIMPVAQNRAVRSPSRNGLKRMNSKTRSVVPKSQITVGSGSGPNVARSAGGCAHYPSIIAGARSTAAAAKFNGSANGSTYMPLAETPYPKTR